MLGYLNKVWATLSKPPGKENCTINEFFDFGFTGLPHKIFARDAFESDAAKLRTRFVNPASSDYLFKPEYHKHIPADGFPMFAEGIWTKIVGNKDLDLPTQTQLLAQHRCDEIAKEVYDELFLVGTSKFKEPLHQGSVLESFGSESNEIVDKVLAEFDLAASRYHTEVYKSKRKELFKKMSTGLHVMYMQLLTNLHRKSLDLFTTTLQLKLTSEDGQGGQFALNLRESVAAAENYFVTIAEQAKLKNSDWTCTTALSVLLEEINKFGTEKRNEAIQNLLKSLEKFTASGLSDSVQMILNEASPSMWKDVLVAFQDVLSAAEIQLRKKLQGFEASPAESDKYSKSLRWLSWTVLMDLLKKEVSDDAILKRLRSRFESKFRYDDAGVPRLWKLDDPIDAHFKSATENAEKVLVLFCRMDFPLTSLGDDIIENDKFDPSCVVLLSAGRLQSIRERFKKDADGLYIEAKRSMVMTTAKIPYWFVALTVVLGWNEFMAVLRNPFYFAMLIITLAGLYATWYMGMIGPAYHVIKATVKEVAHQTKDQLESRGVHVDQLFTGHMFEESATSGSKTAEAATPKRTSSMRKEVVGEEIEMVQPPGGFTPERVIRERKGFSDDQ
ncbi:Dynamin-like GTPase that mediates homotypic ER fusion [Chytridiales sp. JEL 0842]|nr:Dynamin-like GTPase that mediates homotypic ER fusion [Chytridiales sp. JEL 0842]